MPLYSRFVCPIEKVAVQSLRKFAACNFFSMSFLAFSAVAEQSMRTQSSATEQRMRCNRPSISEGAGVSRWFSDYAPWIDQNECWPKNQFSCTDDSLGWPLTIFCVMKRSLLLPFSDLQWYLHGKKSVKRQNQATLSLFLARKFVICSYLLSCSMLSSRWSRTTTDVAWIFRAMAAESNVPVLGGDRNEWD